MGAVLASDPAWALDPEKVLSECTAEVFGIRDGLTGSSVQTISQTQDGYLWVGAQGGLMRYDGAKIVRFELSPTLGVMGVLPFAQRPPLVVTSRAETWCLGNGAAGPCGKSGPVFPRDTRPTAVDNQARASKLWLATHNGLLRVDEASRVLLQSAPPELVGITAVHLDARGRLWVGGTGGLFVSDGAEPPLSFSRHHASDGALAAPVRSIFESAKGHLWVLTDTHLLRIENGTTRAYKQPPELTVGWRSQVIEDRHGNVWLGTQTGLLRFRDQTFAQFTKRDGLPDDDVSALFEDREGSLWVGTRSGALAQFTDRTVSLKAGPPSLHDISIESVCEDAAGALWMGTWLGLTRWQDGQAQLFTVADGLPDNHVYSVLPAADGTLWIGTGAGLARRREGRIEAPFSYRRGVVSLSQDQTGTVWVGTNEGLARVVGDKVEIVPADVGFKPMQVRAVRQDDLGTIWVTSEGGLGRIDGNVLKKADGAPASVAAATRAIFRDTDGTLWFGGADSLVRRRQGQWRLFSLADGVPEDPIYQIQSDDEGYLWIATSRALLRMDKHALETFQRGEGAAPSAIAFDTSEARREVGARRSRSPGSWKTHDGRLLFATLRGLASVDPRRVPYNPIAPSVTIERAMVDGRTACAGCANEFPAGPGYAEFRFGSVTLVEPQKARHRYRLDGIDSGWVEAGTRRIATYAKLPPGRYRFQVKASNADGVWNETGTEMELRLLPPLYRRKWFYALCGVGLLAVAMSLHRIRLTRMRAEVVAVFEERARVARELHDSILQGMTAAALELENVRDVLPPTATTAAARLGAVENAIAASLDETRRLVWNLRDKSVTAGDLGAALTSLAARLTAGRGVACTVRIEGNAKALSNEVQANLFRIAQEALANAIKHADAEQIDLRLAYKGGAVTLTVTDDGRGFDPEEAARANPGHFGLVGMRERAKRLGAEFTLTSELGKGTHLALHLPIEGGTTRG